MNTKKLFMIALLASSLPLHGWAKQWTLKDCIDYAIQNNISLQKTRLQMLSTKEDVKQAQAELLPSLSFSTSQNVNYNPWPETNRATVTNGYVETSMDKVYYNGSYGLNLNWTVWNGNRNRNQLKLDKITAEQAELDSATTANSIQEQIAQLYVQILYSADAVDVCKQSLETSSVNEARGKEFVNVGKMSKADLAQLTAQRAKDEYSLVEAESNLKNYKRQMKQLLQITSEEEFDVAMPTSTDEMAMETIPTLTSVYTAALDSRPEIKNAQLGIDGSELSIKMAKAQRMPTIGFNASAMTNTTSMSSKEWGTQLKNNFSTGAGVTLSIPIFDNRQSKTAIRKAKIQQQQYQLDLQDKQTTLYSTIENYWLQATTNQSKYRAAKANTTSAQESYDLLSEQFRLGLKNTVELMTGKTNLLTAQQNELQSKYLTILNMNMLDFYKGKKVKE
ncbi:outer membrane efflux protein [Prevotella sp. CAG:1092]|nr:outer membrane efflux protein [Prevotella sp. CAG:1092]